MTERVGDIAVVLHSHMPYVEGFGTYPFGEEWLFDAVVRSHLPVLAVADQVTMSVTPVLADQLEDRGTQERLMEFTRAYRVGSAELDIHDVEPDLVAACEAEAERYRVALAELERLDGDVLSAFAEAQDSGRVELLASSATHAVMPLLATREGRLLQLDAGLASHRRRFGEPDGFWLPECAYDPGLEGLLAGFGLGHFCVDRSSYERPGEAMAPIRAGATVAFPIDWEAVSWLWNMQGYPSDPDYADFHSKSMRGCRPWRIGGGAYDPAKGAARAREQAREFAASVAARLQAHRDESGNPGLMTFAIDTELLGHWWWEGPIWLEEALRALPEAGVRLLTLARAREEHEAVDLELRRSSWGEEKDLRTWDSPSVSDLTWAARGLELRVLKEIGAQRLKGPALERAARELLAVQASDWAFLDYTRQAGDYPLERSLAHSRALFEAIDSGDETDPKMRSLAPDLSTSPLLEP